MEESDYFLSNLKSPKCQLLNDRYLLFDDENQKSNENQSNETQENENELMFEKKEKDENQLPPSLTSHLSSSSHDQSPSFNSQSSQTRITTTSSKNEKNIKMRNDHQRIQDSIEFHHDQDQPNNQQTTSNQPPTISPLSPSQLFTYGSSSFISSHSSSKRKRQQKKKCNKRDSNQRRQQQLIGIPKKYHSSHIASKHLKDQFHITNLSSRIRKGNFQDDNIYLPALSFVVLI